MTGVFSFDLDGGEREDTCMSSEYKASFPLLALKSVLQIGNSNLLTEYCYSSPTLPHTLVPHVSI